MNVVLILNLTLVKLQVLYSFSTGKMNSGTTQSVQNGYEASMYSWFLLYSVCNWKNQRDTKTGCIRTALLTLYSVMECTPVSSPSETMSLQIYNSQIQTC